MLSKNIFTSGAIVASMLFGGAAATVASTADATTPSTWTQSKVCHGPSKIVNVNYDIRNAQLTTGATKTTLLVNFSHNVNQYSLAHPTGFSSPQSGQIVVTIKDSLGGDASYLSYNVLTKTLTTWSVEIGTDHSVKTIKNADVSFSGKQMYLNMPKTFFKTTKGMPLNFTLEYVKANPTPSNPMNDDYLFADSSCNS